MKKNLQIAIFLILWLAVIGNWVVKPKAGGAKQPHYENKNDLTEERG